MSFLSKSGAVIFATAMAASVLLPGAHSQALPTKRFVVHDRNGSTLSCEDFRNLQRNGADDRGLNDALLHSSTLDVVELGPLDCEAGTFTIRGSHVPGRTLSLSWPGPRGYSMVLLDLPQASSFAFEDLLADQAALDLSALQSELNQKRVLPPSIVDLIRSRNVSVGARRAKLSWSVFDKLSEAHLQLYERAPKSSLAWRGVTFDSPIVRRDQWLSASSVVGKGGWIRIVLDREEPLDSYKPVVEQAHSAGLRVLGQILDSSEMKALDLDQWKERVNVVVSSLPTIDAWEVANEANGNWLGTDVGAKVTYATRRVKELAPNKQRVLTLLWNLGEDVEDDSVFRWLGTLDRATLSEIDVVGLSIYPEDHPMGTAYNRVVSTLHRYAPRARIGITELGYGNDDLGGTWWWGSPKHKALGKRNVARFYDHASRVHPYSAGGTFWWYFLQEGDVR